MVRKIMDSSGNLFPQLKALAARAKDSRLTILLIGSATTIYTSSMTTPLSGTRIIQVDTGKQGILEIVMWDRIINDLPCRIITLPELGQIVRNIALAQTSIEAIQASITPVHCIWFAARLNETTLNDDEKNVINWITKILGEHAWNYAILVLTHSNTIREAWKRADMMKKRSENIRSEISKYTGWDIAANITAVPVSTLDDIILDGKRWLPELYQQIMRRSNLRGFVTSSEEKAASRDVSSVEKSLQGEGNHQPPEVVQAQETTRSSHWLMFIGWYLSSVLVGTVGMGMCGFKGFIIGLTANSMLWMLLWGLRTFKHPNLLI
ncbi:MAG: hypothetical protein JO215_03860 [Ktedonobacteraceae bacterium]|nr:hypothetical protein [Ktedonobacteraceae bacterium]